jgi:hypothetical protein
MHIAPALSHRAFSVLVVLEVTVVVGHSNFELL